ncbi:MAG: hypothetical protein M3N97_04640 [Pseudomonadota bacterium]|nr:hypothetical protein [Pseudomonadota bacterium]
MRSFLIQATLSMGLLSGCGGESSIKPAEMLDQRSGMTVGALQQPIELVETAQNAALLNGKRNSFAYLGPVEWDTSGDLTYGLWIHVAPGNDRQLSDIRSPGTVTLVLDGDPLVLPPMDVPRAGGGPYQPIASWGQTAYFRIDSALLKRMAGSEKLALDFQAVDQSVVEFLPSRETRATLTQFIRARGITAD